MGTPQPKPRWRWGRTIDVEGIRIDEDLGVAIAGGVHEHHPLTGAQRNDLPP
jgi:hypothetical protein